MAILLLFLSKPSKTATMIEWSEVKIRGECTEAEKKQSNNCTSAFVVGMREDGVLVWKRKVLINGQKLENKNGTNDG